MTQKEELKLYRELLITFHTLNWTGKHDKLKKLVELIAAYSYARTNSNGDEKQEKRDQKVTLENLKKFIYGEES